MNRDVLKGNWNEMKGRVKQHWGKLTDDDLRQVEGSYDELVGNIQKKYGHSKEEAAQEVNKFLESVNRHTQ